MGTVFEVFLRGDDQEHLEAVAVAVSEEIQRLDVLLSRFKPRSEVARVNRAAKTKTVRIDRELFALLECCETARQMTTRRTFLETAGATLAASTVLRADDAPVCVAVSGTGGCGSERRGRSGKSLQSNRNGIATTRGGVKRC